MRPTDVSGLLDMKAIVTATLRIFSDGGMVESLTPQLSTNPTLVFGLDLFSIIVNTGKPIHESPKGSIESGSYLRPRARRQK